MMGNNWNQRYKAQGTHDSPWGCLNIFFSKAWNAWKSTCPNINPTRSWINQTTSVKVHHFLGDLEVQFWTNNFVHIIICHFGSPQLPYIHPIPHWRQPTLWYLGGSTWSRKKHETDVNWGQDCEGWPLPHPLNQLALKLVLRIFQLWHACCVVVGYCWEVLHSSFSHTLVIEFCHWDIHSLQFNL